MFRNVYLEAYKNSTISQSNVEALLLHFNFAYVAMGSILSDLEFAVGKLVKNGPVDLVSRSTAKNNSARQEPAAYKPSAVSENLNYNQQQIYNPAKVKAQDSGPWRTSINFEQYARKQPPFAQPAPSKIQQLQHLSVNRQPVPATKNTTNLQPNPTFQFDDLFKKGTEPISHSNPVKRGAAENNNSSNIDNNAGSKGALSGGDNFLDELFERRSAHPSRK